LDEAASEVALRYPLRILLVEDHKINQKVIKKIFGKIGYTPEVANNGLEALERLENNQFGLVLLDVPMPGMDGIRAAQEIFKADLPGDPIPTLNPKSRSLIEFRRGLTSSHGTIGRPPNCDRSLAKEAVLVLFGESVCG
jgi:response regulator RpfG family c-di-GMP phosphodiesterase|tara:strand:- start:26 stop:442 length:417 start_codon:yes stop_codon:yes gene_type:complete